MSPHSSPFRFEPGTECMFGDHPQCYTDHFFYAPDAGKCFRVGDYYPDPPQEDILRISAMMGMCRSERGWDGECGEMGEGLRGERWD